MFYLVGMCRVCLRTDCELNSSLDVDSNKISNEDKLIACFPDFDWDFCNYKICTICAKVLGSVFQFRQNVIQSEEVYYKYIQELQKIADKKTSDKKAYKFINNKLTVKLQKFPQKTTDFIRNSPYFPDQALHDEYSEFSLEISPYEEVVYENEHPEIPNLLENECSNEPEYEIIGVDPSYNIEEPIITLETIQSCMKNLPQDENASIKPLTNEQDRFDNLMKEFCLKKENVVSPKDQQVQRNCTTIQEPPFLEITFEENSTLKPNSNKNKSIQINDLAEVSSSKISISTENGFRGFATEEIPKEGAYQDLLAYGSIWSPQSPVHVSNENVVRIGYDAKKKGRVSCIKNVKQKRQKKHEHVDGCCSNHKFRHCMSAFLENLHSGRLKAEQVNFLGAGNEAAKGRDEEIKSNLCSHFPVVHKSNACKLCQRRYRKRRNLQIHLQAHACMKPFTCIKCNKIFATKHSLITHIQRHDGFKPWKCIYCSKAFVTKPELDRHIRIHTGETPYKCTYCPRAFKTTTEFASHRRVHSGERPYVCKYCQRTFNRLSSLITHVRRHEDDRRYICSQCHNGFITNHELKRHIKNYH